MYVKAARHYHRCAPLGYCAGPAQYSTTQTPAFRAVSSTMEAFRWLSIRES
jgi:hypothetical protein